MASLAGKIALENTAVVSKLFLGKCVPCVKQQAAKLQIPRLVLDTYINMYFREFEYIFAHDPHQLCKTGDTVLVRSLPERLTRLITHEVVEIVYPLGDVIDPLTGKKVVVSNYRDDIEERNKMFGELDSTFKYKQAPPRGNTENKRDFTHRPHDIKFYKGQPDTV